MKILAAVCWLTWLSSQATSQSSSKTPWQPPAAVAKDLPVPNGWNVVAFTSPSDSGSNLPNADETASPEQKAVNALSQSDNSEERTPEQEEFDEDDEKKKQITEASGSNDDDSATAPDGLEEDSSPQSSGGSDSADALTRQIPAGWHVQAYTSGAQPPQTPPKPSHEVQTPAAQPADARLPTAASMPQVSAAVPVAQAFVSSASNTNSVANQVPHWHAEAPTQNTIGSSSATNSLAGQVPPGWHIEASTPSASPMQPSGPQASDADLASQLASQIPPGWHIESTIQDGVSSQMPAKKPSPIKLWKSEPVSGASQAKPQGWDIRSTVQDELPPPMPAKKPTIKLWKSEPASGAPQAKAEGTISSATRLWKSEPVAGSAPATHEAANTNIAHRPPANKLWKSEPLAEPLYRSLESAGKSMQTADSMKTTNYTRSAMSVSNKVPPRDLNGHAWPDLLRDTVGHLEVIGGENASAADEEDMSVMSDPGLGATAESAMDTMLGYAPSLSASLGFNEENGGPIPDRPPLVGADVLNHMQSIECLTESIHNGGQPCSSPRSELTHGSDQRKRLETKTFSPEPVPRAFLAHGKALMEDKRSGKPQTMDEAKPAQVLQPKEAPKEDAPVVEAAATSTVFGKMTLSQLRKQAAAYGATVEETDAALDDSEPREALTSLILSKQAAAEKVAAETAAREAEQAAEDVTAEEERDADVEIVAEQTPAQKRLLARQRDRRQRAHVERVSKVRHFRQNSQPIVELRARQHDRRHRDHVEQVAQATTDEEAGRFYSQRIHEVHHVREIVQEEADSEVHHIQKVNTDEEVGRFHKPGMHEVHHVKQIVQASPDSEVHHSIPAPVESDVDADSDDGRYYLRGIQEVHHAKEAAPDDDDRGVKRTYPYRADIPDDVIGLSKTTGSASPAPSTVGTFMEPRKREAEGAVRSMADVINEH